ncbi:type II toxin-antitoxin system VapB family antitoxin [Methylopila sp. M107]|uniref:type II toxin-antitoxin system VapB family antitoxin n=1 Tax=Methylopila sp. M107 TaxID=1101190 RepID=UPI00036C7F6A|nr:type II toxin-antitoxin system VapB family antitoxin [Methylopila sp. M107]
MVLNIRNAEADALARQLAEIDRSSITEAVVTALRETIGARRRSEAAIDTARAILKRHGVQPSERMSRPVTQDVWDGLHEDLSERS